ncbi:type II 3-dehydroquinate dehydratase [Psychrobacter sp. I-STPA6b]|uniref:type II 3-dehydroquinate dehydratase n=1 Tax=Psychrobacter sp. I-STPA6b TaxID=2585718 RepID=UPI001D0C2E9B|nr:type II 3-dehydroquinate dehydratase [Psychrobacter sp. I-STPA6b]
MSDLTSVQLNQSQKTVQLKQVLLINGPNLNLLGKREPEIYGSDTLTDIEENLKNIAKNQNINLICFQSNHEGEILDTIHQFGLLNPVQQRVDGIIINPGAFTHTSIAIRDALLAVSVPFIEVHLSNVHQRESFRTHSYLSDCAIGVICGFGAQGYEMALQYLARQYTNKD